MAKRMCVIRSFLHVLVLVNVAAGGAAFADSPVSPACKRLVSLAPSVTEVLYSLELESQLVGVTSFCRFPPQAKEKTSVGGLFDLNIERLVVLSPTTVILFAEYERERRLLGRLGIQSTVVEHRHLQGVLDSITEIGKICGIEERARLKREELERSVEKIKASISGPKIRTLIAVGRTDDRRLLRSVFLSGADGYYSDLLEIAGGENVFGGITTSMANLSTEGVLTLNPEVIIEIVPHLKEKGWSRDSVISTWNTLPSVTAVKEGRVHVMTSDYSAVPGPRFVLLLEELVKILHPGVS